MDSSLLTLDIIILYSHQSPKQKSDEKDNKTPYHCICCP